MKINTIDTTTSIREFDPKKYNEYTYKWWSDEACPYSYSYLSLDNIYPDEYFFSMEIHPSSQMAVNIYNYMQHTYNELFATNFNSILELGTGAGEFTREFHNNGLDCVSVEGTSAGVSKLLSLNIPKDRIIHSDLRLLKKLDRRFDIVVCTEVVEHIEPWFASKIVENCILHSDVVWLSACPPGKPNQAHYHHSNEAPIHAWDNIFAFFGYNNFVELNRMYERADRLYLNEAAMKRVKNENI